MIYSCFNEALGEYEYFEDGAGHPMNGDLPMPSLASEAGGIGVPARDAGRKLPSGSKPTGRGWEARGMIVNCQNTKVKGLSGSSDTPPIPLWLMVIGAGALMYGGWKLYVHSMENLHRR